MVLVSRQVITPTIPHLCSDIKLVNVGAVQLSKWLVTIAQQPLADGYLLVQLTTIIADDWSLVVVVRWQLLVMMDYYYYYYYRFTPFVRDKPGESVQEG